MAKKQNTFRDIASNIISILVDIIIILVPCMLVGVPVGVLVGIFAGKFVGILTGSFAGILAGILFFRTDTMGYDSYGRMASYQMDYRMTPEPPRSLSARRLAALRSKAIVELENPTSGYPSPEDIDLSPGDEVELSAFAPKTCSPGQTFLIQALIHLPEDRSTAHAMAVAADQSTDRRAARTLVMPVQRGERLDLDLEAVGCRIDDPRQTITWLGQPETASFFVTVPDKQRASIPVRITVARFGVPVGTLKFVMALESGRQDQRVKIRGDKAKRFSRAFLSYASGDRVSVLRYAQSLDLVGIEVFQDVLSLEPGERWQKRLYTEINNCDLFLLFWSDAARQSKWVVKEAKYALDCSKRNDDERPDVKPVILEGPPVPKPPRGLGAIHFNDKFRYFIAAAELEEKARREAKRE